MGNGSLPRAEISRRPPPDGALAVLRPKSGWRLLSVPATLFFVAVLTGLLDDDGGGSVFWGWVCVVFFAIGSVAAWRSRIELHERVVYRRGVLGWVRPVRAAEIEEVTLHYDPGIKDYPHRVLRITTYDRDMTEVSFRWWRHWWKLIGWLATYCTRVESDELVWAVRTDGKTRDRLEPYAKRLQNAPAAPESARRA